MKEQIIKLLKKIVEIKSNYPNELKISKFILNYFKTQSYHVKKQIVEKNRFNVLVKKNKIKKSFVLYSHLDTVNIVDGWQTNPLKLTIIKDRAYGLGAWDMKGGMVANILTFLNFQPKNFNLKLVFCVDEENISKGAFKLIKSEFLSDANLVISTEPAFFYGNQGIVIGRPGRAVYNLTITCNPKHYGFYEKKFDINIFLAEIIKELSKFYKKSNQKKQFIFVRKISSKTIGMSTPYEIDLELDSSILPPLTNNQLKSKIENKLQLINKKFNNYFKFNLTYFKRKTPFLEGYELKKNNLYLKILKKSILNITGKKAIPYFRSSIADENIFGSNKIPILGIGPEGANAHSANEWVSISSIEKLYNILINFLNSLDRKYDLAR